MRIEIQLSSFQSKNKIFYTRKTQKYPFTADENSLLFKALNASIAAKQIPKERIISAAFKNLQSNSNMVIPPADKRNSTVVLDVEDYSSKSTCYFMMVLRILLFDTPLPKSYRKLLLSLKLWITLLNFKKVSYSSRFKYSLAL